MSDCQQVKNPIISLFPMEFKISTVIPSIFRYSTGTKINLWWATKYFHCYEI